MDKTGEGERQEEVSEQQRGVGWGRTEPVQSAVLGGRDYFSVLDKQVEPEVEVTFL